ncbi:MAG: VWA domain-containing protein [Acidobacteria bacterium]|nr:VWA domain-containing protein [Acidobacteriota bacterium]
MGTSIRRRLFRKRIGKTILVLAFFPSLACAQQSPAILKVRSELVDIPVCVLDSHGNAVENLQQKDFRVLTDGIEQPISYFTPVSEPAMVFLLVETSPAVYLIQSQHVIAAHALLYGLAPDDSVAVGIYNDTARPILDFTSDKHAVFQALQVYSAQYSLGMSRLNLFSSLQSVLEQLRAIPGKKSLVLLSTGLDGGDSSTRQQLLEALQSSELTIFSVALGGSLRESNKKKSSANAGLSSEGFSFAQADENLRAIASASGGQAYFPKSAADFQEIYRRVSALIRNQYRLGISPLRDGKVHRISVQVADARGRFAGASENKSAYRISFRQGYLAPPREN